MKNYYRQCLLDEKPAICPHRVEIPIEQDDGLKTEVNKIKIPVCVHVPVATQLGHDKSCSYQTDPIGIEIT
jgi:hypothetical protein